MNTKFKYVILATLIAVLSACHQEDALTPVYEYDGPLPAIADGPSKAQRLCYELYQKYDLQVYYTLSGQEALRTMVGWTQNVSFNEEFLPFKAGDETVSASFLTLLKKFCDLLPDGMAQASELKRQVLVKGTIANPWMSLFFMGFRSIAVSEGQQGIVYYGNMDDGTEIDVDVWKYSIAYEYFRGITEAVQKRAPMAMEFGRVSKGIYAGEQDDYYEALYSYYLDESYEGENEEYVYYLMDMDALMADGFVNPQGLMKGDSKVFVNEDLATYATWIVLNPKANRQESLDTYPKVKKKYDLTIEYFKKVYDMDLEAFSMKWAAVTL